MDFLGEVRGALPFSIDNLRCDNATEFSLAFALTMQEEIRLRYIRPRQPLQNGKVERSHRIDNEEFWRREGPPDSMTRLQGWERRCYFDRFSVALKGETPAEKLQRLPTAKSRDSRESDRHRGFRSDDFGARHT